MNIYFVITTIVFGFLSSIPALVMGYFLDKKGLAAYQPYLTIFLYICVLFWIRLAAPRANLIFVICFLILGSPSIYSQGLWFTYKKGRWWWKSNDSNTK
jgi:hypothetical protein